MYILSAEVVAALATARNNRLVSCPPPPFPKKRGEKKRTDSFLSSLNL